MENLRTFAAGGFALLASAAPAFAGTVNGAPDNQTDSLGYYDTVGGGLFPNGQVRNGDNASGGTMRFFTDDPIWGQPLDTWRKDDWFPVTSSLVARTDGAARRFSEVVVQRLPA